MHPKMNSETKTFLLLETMYIFREQVSNPQLATFVALAQLTSGFFPSFFLFFLEENSKKAKQETENPTFCHPFF